MNALVIYLFKSATWLAGFSLVYFLLLRNERFFSLNRLYLLFGIFASLLMPLITIHYYIDFPPAGDITAGKPEFAGIKPLANHMHISLGFALSAFYLAGAVVVIAGILIRSRAVLRAIRKSDVIPSEKIKLVRTDDYPGSFSFFSYVFVNPSVSDVETREIMNHELGHIRQKHWVDLVLAEVLCILQWFNPFSWIYSRFIRQNHEYLADAEALQRSSDPAVYRATLLNQIAGEPVFILANSFNYSINKKRFKMMKNIISSPYRKMKVLFIFPVLALLLYAFSKPEYRTPSGSAGTTIQSQGKDVYGKVRQQSGSVLSGTNVIIQGTTTGTITDSKGEFRLKEVGENAVLLFTYVGFKTKAVKAVFNKEMDILMVRDTVNVDGGLPGPPPPPPPPPPPVPGNGKKPLVIIDGKITDADIRSLDSKLIESINVLDEQHGKEKYGDKAKDGALEIKMKKPGSGDQKSDEKVYVVVEQMPEFPGGNEALMKFMIANFKYPGEAAKKGITGKVMVTFVVQADGKVSNIKVETPVNPLLDAEAIRLVSIMPAWTPGKQNGKDVDVVYKLPVDFKLK
ncbi:MAG TPA: TonB family protein [Bacteroidales bacterium]|nr:TonB family protein [Bacteroidales bacterium]